MRTLKKFCFFEEPRENPGTGSGLSPDCQQIHGHERLRKRCAHERGFLMKVTLRNPDTDLYFVGPNMWTNDRSRAFDFERMEQALELARGWGFFGFELVVSISGLENDMRVVVAQMEQAPPAAEARVG